MGDRTRCDSSALQQPPENMRVCDGKKPSNVGQNIPKNGHGPGLQFACYWNVLCDSCALELDYDVSKYWFCHTCTAPVTCRQDVSGRGIMEPYYFRPPLNSAAASSWPSSLLLFSSGEQPCDYWTRKSNERASRRRREVLATPPRQLYRHFTNR